MKNPLYRKMSPEEDRTRDAVDSEPKHYQLSYSGPVLLSKKEKEGEEKEKKKKQKEEEKKEEGEEGKRRRGGKGRGGE